MNLEALKLRFAILRAWMKLQAMLAGRWLETKWLALDDKADAKLGFIAAPLLGVIGGGIPAWLLSRGLVILALWLGGAYLVKQHDNKVREENDAAWNAKLAKQVAVATARKQQIAREAEARVVKVDEAWKDAYDKMGTYAGQLELVLKATEAEANTAKHEAATALMQCVPPAAVDALRGKARAINRAGLK